MTSRTGPRGWSLHQTSARTVALLPVHELTHVFPESMLFMVRLIVITFAVGAYRSARLNRARSVLGAMQGSSLHSAHACRA